MFNLAVNSAIVFLLTNLAFSIHSNQYSVSTTVLVTVLIVFGLSLLAITPLGGAFFRANSELRPLTKEEDGYLQPLIGEVIAKSGIKTKLYITISPDNFPVGAVYGLDTIALSEPLLRCTPEEIKAVMAHELGHIKNKDCHIYCISYILDAIGMVALTISMALLTVITNAIKLFLPFLLLVLVLKLVQMMLGWFIKISYLPTKRSAELKADAYAAKLGYGDGLVSYLNRVGDRRKTAIFSTHPLNKVRIANLT